MHRFVFCFAFALAAHAQTNRVANFSFEQAGSPSSNALNWNQAWRGYARDCVTGNVWDGSCTVRLIGASADLSGFQQTVVFNQSTAVPIRITMQIKGQGIQNLAGDKYGATLYAKVTYRNGASEWCPMTPKTKNVGNFDWRFVGCNTAQRLPSGNLPVASVTVGGILGAIGGTAWFDDVHVAEYNPGLFNGAVTLMFDDCYKEHRTYVMPALQSRGWVGAEAAVTNYLESGDPAYCNLQDLSALRNAGWEILSHSVDHSNLIALSASAAENQLYWSKRYLTDRGFNVKHFALPFGEYNGTVIGINEERGYYQSIRTSDQGYNPMGSFPHAIQVQKMESHVTLAQVNTWLTEARNRKAWLILLIHKVRDVCPDAICITKTTFQNTLTAVQGSTLPVVTYDQGLSLVKALD